MKILHLINTMAHSDGGPPAVVEILGEAQADRGNDVAILTLCDREAASGRVKRYTLGLRQPLRRLFPDSFQRAIAHFRTADIVHIHGVWDPFLIRTIRWCISNAKPCCVTPHGLLTAYSVRQKYMKKWIALHLGWRWHLNGVGFIHCLTSSERSDIAALGIQAALVEIPNAVPLLDSSVCLRARNPADHVLASGRSYILALSRLHAIKRLDLLVEAYALLHGRMPAVDLVIAGPDFGREQLLLQQVDRLGLNASVHFLGPVYGDAKKALLAGATCFAQFSENEGLSVAILEALAAGVPVVISAGCHFSHVESAGAGFVVSPQDVPASSASLERIVGSPSTREQMGIRARTLIERSYSPSAVADAMIRAYETHTAVIEPVRPKQTAHLS